MINVFVLQPEVKSTGLDMFMMVNFRPDELHQYMKGIHWKGKFNQVKCYSWATFIVFYLFILLHKRCVGIRFPHQTSLHNILIQNPAQRFHLEVTKIAILTHLKEREVLDP